MAATAPSPVEKGSPLRLVYILGSYRSGTTVLGALLGTAPGVQTGGEMQVLPAGFWERHHNCSCGEPIAQCPFWIQVRRGAEARVDLRDLDVEQRRFESFSALAGLLPSALFGSKALAKHIEHVVGFTEALAEVNGANVVVDLSKNPVRGYLRRFVPPGKLEVYFVHVVRDGRAVMYSRVERPGGGQIEPMMRTSFAMAIRWVVVNLLASLLCGRNKGRYVRIRYEELVRAPRETLEPLGRFLRIDLSSVIDALDREEPVPMHHLVAANLRLRQQSSFTLRLDDSWRTELPRTSSRMFWWIGGWLARYYGYEASP